MFIASIIIFNLRNFRLEMDLDTKEYDLSTVSAGDYTVEMDISESQYYDFVAEHKAVIDEKFEGSIARAFKDFLK